MSYTKKVRCENCDAVLDAQETRTWLHPDWLYHYKCYHCGSVRTVETREPYRPPRWERMTKARLEQNRTNG